jgi:hypothetical protein
MGAQAAAFDRFDLGSRYDLSLAALTGLGLASEIPTYEQVSPVVGRIAGLLANRRRDHCADDILVIPPGLGSLGVRECIDDQGLVPRLREAGHKVGVLDGLRQYLDTDNDSIGTPVSSQASVVILLGDRRDPLNARRTLDTPGLVYRGLQWDRKLAELASARQAAANSNHNLRSAAMGELLLANLQRSLVGDTPLDSRNRAFTIFPNYKAVPVGGDKIPMIPAFTTIGNWETRLDGINTAVRPPFSPIQSAGFRRVIVLPIETT